MIKVKNHHTPPTIRPDRDLLKLREKKEQICFSAGLQIRHYATKDFELDDFSLWSFPWIEVRVCHELEYNIYKEAILNLYL